MEGYSKATVATYKVVKENLKEGQCLLTNKEIAALAGFSERAVKDALSTLRKDGKLFVCRKGGFRKLSFQRSPRIDRQMVLGKLVERVLRFRSLSAEGLFFESRKKTAEALGVSVPVLREVYEMGERQGVLLRSYVERKGKRVEAWSVVEKEATPPLSSSSSNADVELLRVEVASLTRQLAEAKKALSNAPSTPPASSPSQDSFDARFILENEELKEKNLDLSNQVKRLEGTVNLLEGGYCKTCDERDETKLEQIYFVQRHLIDVLGGYVPSSQQANIYELVVDRLKSPILVRTWNELCEVDQRYLPQKATVIPFPDLQQATG